jgi:RNA-directed DNA polymerase
LTDLIWQIADYRNLTAALRHCRKGKRASAAYQKMLLSLPDSLISTHHELLSGTYQWLPYHKMMVCDPKKREILVAPFRDRIVHQAMCQILGPTMDLRIPKSSFACRINMGNQNAVLSLHHSLKQLGHDRYAIKLDIKKYFASIDHETLMTMLRDMFQERNIQELLKSLLGSHLPFKQKSCGIPIGSVTSQYFANLFLSPIDRHLESNEDVHYIRYMDDMVLWGRDKEKVKSIVHEVYDLLDLLKLEVPPSKKVPLGRDPIPFLGFVIDHNHIRCLSRNKRRFRRRIKRLEKKNSLPSQIAEMQTSFLAWSALESRCQ